MIQAEEKVRDPFRRGGGAFGPEWRNYLEGSLLRGSLARLSWSLRAVSRRLGRGPSKRAVRPDYLSPEDLRLADSRNDDDAQLRFPLSEGGSDPASPAGTEEWARRYAGLYRDWLGGTPPPSPDREEYWTLHQFGWLFALALLRSPEAGPSGVREAIGEWLARLGRSTGDQAWRSFSISERLCNWLRLFEVLGPEAMPAEAPAGMALQASHLARHLECFEDGSTNNHLLNNGRALYLCGARLGREDLLRIGRLVLLNEAARQFTLEGFLDEGSSHYHLIFTRAYLDALEAAAAIGDREFREELEAQVSCMLRACAYFADDRAPAEWRVPLLGDVSPDPPPALFDREMRFWEFARRASSGEQIDSHSGWFRRARSPAPDPAAFAEPGGWSVHPLSGHYRFSNGCYRIWWHARRKGAPRLHSHNDWGSFQLHAGGEPLFIDPGRYSYSLEVDSFDQRLTLAQNAAAVDGFEQALFRRRELFLPAYLDDGAEVRWSEKESTISFEIHGYRRLRRPVTHTRLFRLEPEEILVSDRFEGPGGHRAVLAFHLHPGVRWTREGDGSFLFSTPGGLQAVFGPDGRGSISTKTGGDPEAPGGYCSNAYGVRFETTTVFAEYETAAGLSLEHRIRLVRKT